MSELNAGDHHVDPDLLELYEVLEFQRALERPLARLRSAGAPFLVGSSPFVTRANWGARPARSAAASIASTMRGNTAHYEGPHMGDYPHSSCATKVRGIQAFHMDTRKWADIAYSTIECPHGYIYECRGFAKRTAAQGTNEGNSQSHAHCVMIGDGDAFPDLAKRALRDIFLDYESKGSGKVRKVHQDWHSTSCPGGLVATYVRSGMPPVGPAQPEPATPPVVPKKEKRSMLVRYQVGTAQFLERPYGLVSLDRGEDNLGFDPAVGGANPNKAEWLSENSVLVPITQWQLEDIARSLPRGVIYKDSPLHVSNDVNHPLHGE